MQFIKPDVSTICVGIAMSMGALLLAGGAEGKRMALPNSKILIHQVWGGYQGQASDIEIHARETIALKRRLEEIMSEHTGQAIEKVRQDMDRDFFMTSEEAKEYGHHRPRARAPLEPRVAGPGENGVKGETWRERARATSSCSAASAARASAR